MASTKISDKHATFQTAHEFKEASQEFLSYAQIDGFYWAHVSSNNKTAMLTMHPVCNRAIFDADLAPRFEQLQEGTIYLPTQKNNHRVELNRWFKTFHQLEITQKHADGFHIFGFCSHEDRPEMINHYLNNLGKFHYFMERFEKDAKSLIDKALSDPISTPFTPLENSISVFPRKLEIQDSQFKKITLSQRELELMQNLCHGHTLKEIANLMALSVRTVESYLNNIKNKLALNKRSELVSFYHEHQLPL